MPSKKKPKLISHNEKESDLYDLLMEGNQRPEGKYNHATWEISTKGEVDTDAALVTSIHEAMHDQLNNSIKLSVKDDLILAEMRRHDELKDKEFWPQEM